MTPTFAVGNLIQHAVSQMKNPQNQLTLKENQIVRGEVLKLFPDQKAHIQVGNSKLVAQLEAPINALQSYWFRVKRSSSHQGIELKVIKQVEGDKVSKEGSTRDFLTLFNQKITKENMLFSNELLKENIPVTKDQLVTALDLIKNIPKGSTPQAIEAIKFALKQQYPITESVIIPLINAQSSTSLANEIVTLSQTLQKVNHLTPAVKLLTLSLTELMNNPVDQLPEGLLPLKELLYVASNEVEAGVIKEQMTQLITRLNGQILLHQDHGPTSQFITQVPLFTLNQTDLTIQWHGKKRSDGTIDPAFCRIFFYLQLPNLFDTMIDVQIQNRILSITITNNHELLKELVKSRSEDVKKVLNNMNYQVSSINVRPFETKHEQSEKIKNQIKMRSNTSYTGVDIKI